MIDGREIPPSIYDPLYSSLLSFGGKKRRRRGKREGNFARVVRCRRNAARGHVERRKDIGGAMQSALIHHPAIRLFPGISCGGTFVSAKVSLSAEGKSVVRPALSGFKARRLSHGCETTKIELAGTRGCCFSNKEKFGSKRALLSRAPFSRQNISNQHARYLSSYFPLRLNDSSSLISIDSRFTDSHDLQSVLQIYIEFAWINLRVRQNDEEKKRAWPNGREVAIKQKEVSKTKTRLPRRNHRGTLTNPEIRDARSRGRARVLGQREWMETREKTGGEKRFGGTRGRDGERRMAQQN